MGRGKSEKRLFQRVLVKGMRERRGCTCYSCSSKIDGIHTGDTEADFLLSGAARGRRDAVSVIYRRVTLKVTEEMAIYR